MNYLAFLLESGSGDVSSSGGLFGGGFTIIFMVIVMGVMFFITNRNQKKQEKETQDMRDSLQVGDEVTTIGGIIGKVVSIKEDTFVLETTKEKTHIRFLKSAIRSIDVKIADITASAEAKAEPQKAEEAPKKKFSLFKKKDKE